MGLGDERFGLHLVDTVQLGVQRHVQEISALVLVEVHGRGHLDVGGLQGELDEARRRRDRAEEAGRVAGPKQLLRIVLKQISSSPTKWHMQLFAIESTAVSRSFFIGYRKMPEKRENFGLAGKIENGLPRIVPLCANFAVGDVWCRAHGVFIAGESWPTGGHIPVAGS